MTRQKLHNMNENSRFWLTLIIGLIGAAAWLSPWVYEAIRINKFDGKIISIYNNVTKDRKTIYFLFKLSVISRNKDYFLRDIDLKIKFPSSQYLTATARNNRLVVFNIDGVFKKLTIKDKDFLNNLSVLKKDFAEVGYLFFSIDYDKDEPIEEVAFIFKSYDKNKQRTINFKQNDIQEKKLLFDDSIWTAVNTEDPEIKKLLSLGIDKALVSPGS